MNNCTQQNQSQDPHFMVQLSFSAFQVSLNSQFPMLAVLTMAISSPKNENPFILRTQMKTFFIKCERYLSLH